MKISSLGTATLGCALALAAGSVLANVTPNLQDGSGNAVKDGSGACVVTSGQVLPECAGVKARGRRIDDAKRKTALAGAPFREFSAMADSFNPAFQISYLKFHISDLRYGC